MDRGNSGIRRLARLMTVIACVALFSSSAWAGMLADDANAMAAWRGNVLTSHTYGGVTLDVDLQYAVYAFGHYPGVDPSGGTEFVYAYQIFNEAASTVGVTVLSVGLGPEHGAGNIGFDASVGAPGIAGGVVPDISTIGSSSALWAFGWLNGLEIAPGQHSAVLLYTSLKIPQFNSATLTDGGLPLPGGDVASPSPFLPEPATLSLLTVGIVSLLVKRRRA